MLGDGAPVAGSFLLNKLDEEVVLVLAPRGIVFD